MNYQHLMLGVWATRNANLMAIDDYGVLVESPLNRGEMDIRILVGSDH